MSVRTPAVAGSFYPAEKSALEAAIRECYLGTLGPGRLPPAEYQTQGIVACVSPHAGYEYSGPVAAHSYLHVSSLRRPELVVVVAPNHYGVGSGVSTFREGEWETPLGRVKVDSEAAGLISKTTGIVDFDPASHRMEHSLEVQLPFLQMLYGSSFPLLPICIAFQDQETTTALAAGVVEVLRGRKAVLVASSDMTHYEPDAQARSKDGRLLKKVEAMDVDGFYSTLERLDVSACGYGAISTVMQACSALGLKRGELLKYATSGDSTGDLKQVVGYASLRFV